MFTIFEFDSSLFKFTSIVLSSLVTFCNSYAFAVIGNMNCIANVNIIKIDNIIVVLFFIFSHPIYISVLNLFYCTYILFNIDFNV